MEGYANSRIANSWTRQLADTNYVDIKVRYRIISNVEVYARKTLINGLTTIFNCILLWNTSSWHNDVFYVHIVIYLKLQLLYWRHPRVVQFQIPVGITQFIARRLRLVWDAENSAYCFQPFSYTCLAKRTHIFFSVVAKFSAPIPTSSQSILTKTASLPYRWTVQSYSLGGAKVQYHVGTSAPPGEYDWTCASFGPSESTT